MELAEVMGSTGHEQVVFAGNADLGMRLIIAIHSTQLGPSLGGIRFWSYPDEHAAVRDVLALSEAMSMKASMAGLDLGGGKAVCMVADPPEARSEAFLHEVGLAIHQLGGRYLAAEDVGASPRDMDLIAEVTPWVTGVDPAKGGSGDPSPLTARGVLAGMRAACARAFGEASVAGRRVVVQGAGHVGSHLVRLLVDADAEVAVADRNPERAHALRDELGVTEIDAGAVLREPADIFAPCALGGMIAAADVEHMPARVVCGGANNPLVDAAADEALAANGIVYAPDFVVNAGGIINLAEEFTGYSLADAEVATDRIEATTANVLDEGDRRGTAPGATASALARERIAREGTGRWTPGDATAWTDGEPLRTLRPGH